MVACMQIQEVLMFAVFLTRIHKNQKYVPERHYKEKDYHFSMINIDWETHLI